MATFTTQRGTALAITAQKVERGLIRARDIASNIFDRVQLRLRAAAVARDPETKRWADEMRERVRNGSIDLELEERAREHYVTDFPESVT